MTQVAPHEVGAANANFLGASILEVIGLAVF